jgi:hypothetical protein
VKKFIGVKQKIIKKFNVKLIKCTSVLVGISSLLDVRGLRWLAGWLAGKLT